MFPNDDAALIYIDNVEKSHYSPGNGAGSTDLCGDGFTDVEVLNTFVMAHTASSFTLKFSSTLDSPASDESWGVRDVYIFLS